MRRLRNWILASLLAGAVTSSSLAMAQTPTAAQIGKAQTALDQASQSGKTVFLVFYKEENAAFQKMVEVVKAGVQKNAGKAESTSVLVTHPSEQSIVDRFQLGRAPMPLTLAIAPNGAVTGIFSRELTEERFQDAFVTPTMMRCMKSLQENRLVFVCVQNSEKAIVPAAVNDLQKDPTFKDRIVVVSMNLSDPAETKFLNQMQINPQAPMLGTTAALLAPPGVLIGKYDATSTAAQIATALHQAGKCCDDPNCKHNHTAPAQATRPAPAQRK